VPAIRATPAIDSICSPCFIVGSSKWTPELGPQGLALRLSEVPTEDTDAAAVRGARQLPGSCLAGEPAPVLAATLLPLGWLTRLPAC